MEVLSLSTELPVTYFVVYDISLVIVLMLLEQERGGNKLKLYIEF